MDGLNPKDKFSFKLTAEDGYGNPSDEMIIELEKKIFEIDGKIDEEMVAIGKTVTMQDQNGNPNTQYTIDSKFVGVILDITPQISDNGEIILSIAPRISSFRDMTQLSNQTLRDMPPDTRDNTMLSVVKVKDNDTIVLGGLISDDESLKVNGVPILKEIPLIKYLFSSKEKITTKKELVFVITPHIIDLKKKKTLRDLGFGELR